MEKQLELLKKLKALADRGVAGEAKNAQVMLDKLMQKHGISLSELEDEQVKLFYWNADGIDREILLQCKAMVSRDRSAYGFPEEKIKEFSLGGNVAIDCTISEFLEIDQMFAVYSRLYKSESRVFFMAFLKANNLLPPPRDENKQPSKEEIKEWMRIDQLSKGVKTETIRKALK
jgi:hypothetical protein